MHKPPLIPTTVGALNESSAVVALQRIATQLRRAGATLPLTVTAEAPTIESSMARGLSLALCLVEVEIETCRLEALRSGAHASILVNWHSHVKAARESAGMTSARLGELVDLPPDVIDRWESGEVRTIDGTTLMDVCAALSIDPAWLLGADDA